MCDKAFSIAKNPKYEGYHWVLTRIVYNFFDKKLLAADLKIAIFQNEQKNYTNQLLKNPRKEEYNHLSYAIFWVLIWMIYQY